MSALFYYMAAVGGFCLLLPAATILFHPIYKLFGGELTLVEIWRGL